MLKKLLKYPKIALINTRNTDFFGYKLVLDQEKIPYDIMETIKSEFDVVILPKEHHLVLKNILDYLKRGGSIISSFDFLSKEDGSSTIIDGSVNTFVPYGNGVIYYFSFNFGEEVLNPKMYSPSTGRNTPSQWILSSIKHKIDNNKRQHRMHLKNILYRLVGPLTQIAYWPSPYEYCFCQRIDADFPLTLFYKKDKIITEMFGIIKEFKDINFTIFLNHSFPNQIDKIKLLSSSYRNVELQSHGCDNNIKHRDYCYSLDLLDKESIRNMLNHSVIEPGFTIFAPPCEQLNKPILDCCQELNIQYLSAGGLAKDDIPRRCYYEGTEYDIFNIPTSEREFLNDIDKNYYSNHFSNTIKDNSLFCIYFHPATLLDKESQKKISKFLYYDILDKKKEGKLWNPFMGELAKWWAMRNRVNIINGELTFRDLPTKDFFSIPKNKLSIIKWYPDHTQKLS